MAEIKNIYEDSERTKEIYPITHEKAVIDNNGTTAETKFQMITDLVNQKQMEIGAVPSDLTPTEGSANWVTSGGIANVIYENENFTFLDGFYIDKTDGGWIKTSSDSCITDLLKLDDYYKIYYSGSSGGVWCWFYDADKKPIPDAYAGIANTEVENEELTQYAPSSAVYIRMSSRNLTHSSPPSHYPSAFGIRKVVVNSVLEDRLKNGIEAYYNFGIKGTYNSSGQIVSVTTNYCTELIDISELQHLYYTGSLGGEVTKWFAADKSFIGMNLYISGETLVDFDVLPYKMGNAKYVGLTTRNSSHSSPPTTTPRLVAYKYLPNNDDLFKYFNVPTDGVTDATSALQNVIDASGAEVNLMQGTYAISSPLQVNTAFVKVFNGNDALLKVTADVAAIEMVGTCSNVTAEPSTLTEAQKLEANTVIRNVRITSSDMTKGEGIVISNTFQPIIEKCFIYHIKNGIVLRNRNRNGIIEGNNIWDINNAGLLIDSELNMHQCNIYGNHISYAQICVLIDNPSELANFQFTGNDIEISTTPNYDRTNSRCFVFNYSATGSSSLASEFEIVGNTIQGHSYSNCLIEFNGNSTTPIANVSIVGNQISNVAGNAVELSHVRNFTMSGNTYKDVTGKVVHLKNTIDVFSICNDTCKGGSTGFLGCDASSTLYSISVSNCVGRGMSKAVELTAATINGISIVGNNVASGNVSVAATTLDYINVVGNMCRGAYSIGNATHKNVANNI